MGLLDDLFDPDQFQDSGGLLGRLVSALPQLNLSPSGAGIDPQNPTSGNAGYFCRVGVLQRHWGYRLQLRLTRAVEARARRNGWSCPVSDTTGNIVSANNFIRAGYRMYAPRYPWAFPDTLYWRKSLIPGGISS